jgi:hypothetical protein
MNKTKLNDIQQDSNLVAQIKEIILAARQKAYTAVNFAMVEAYWLMGKRIVEEEQMGNERAAYGEAILKTLSKELTKEFGSGFGIRNLWDFRKFYLTFPETEIMHTLCAQLSWSHIRLVMRVENKLEQAIINQMQKFLLEMGKGFAFVDRQKLIRTETGDFYIDLVFYNYILKCFVLIELKTHKITHQDIGQLDMYVRMYDDLQKTDTDNPTIGILLCTETDNTIARYSVLKENRQLFASKYMPYLPSEEELTAEIERQKEIFAMANLKH